MSEVRIIKKYPNRRLYDTMASSYITIGDLKQMVISRQLFRVTDAKTDNDLTRVTLLQILLEEEIAGKPIFSIDMLENMIRFYGNAMESMVGTYLEKNIHVFLDIQEQITQQSQEMLRNQLPTVPFNQDVWSQFANFQGPMIQNIINNYMEQSKSMFLQMQERVHNQSESFFPASTVNTIANNDRSRKKTKAYSG